MTRFVDLLHVTLLCLSVIRTAAQTSSFLSIDCGAKDKYTDGAGIDWVTDDGYISTGENLEIDITIQQGQEPYPTARYFPENRNKQCYVLPATTSTTYLVRVVIMHGGTSVLPLPFQFDMTVDSNYWFTHSLGLNDGNLKTPVVFESILYNQKDTIDVCLQAAVEGIPFISSLELRVMPPGTYVTAEGGGKFMDMTYRYNTGAKEQVIIRYPDDQYDRFWFPTDTESFPKGVVITNSSALVTPDSFEIGYNIPPDAVMTDAWEGDDLSYSWFMSKGTTRLYIAMYFQEIRRNVTVSESDPNGMLVAVNGDPFEYNVTSRRPQEIFYNVNVTGTAVNISIFSQPWAKAKAYLNAFELYSTREFNSTYTNAKDVATLLVLQNSFNLSSWTGDPCYPVSYNWVSCDANSRISGLFLSNKDITGTIPTQIGDLAGLKEIYLDNNHLSGSIPVSLRLLSNLVVLSLDNNSLSGGIPSDFQNKAGFTFSGNPNLTLCQSTDTNCNAPPTTETKSKSSNTGLIIGVVVGVIIAVIVVIVLIICYRRRKPTPTPTRQANGNYNVNGASAGGAMMHHSGQPPLVPIRVDKHSMGPESYPNSTSWPTESSQVSDVSAHSHPSGKNTAFAAAGYISMNEVLAATRNHQKKIGEGAYGPVYYGRLANGKEVAVKVNKIGALQGNDEFVNEVALLTRVHHKNLVSLLAFCEENNERILVYEYQHNGTLSDLLYGPNAAAKPLNWRTRLDIALSAAKGLEYLHTGCNPRIIHRDIKSNNILIDDKMVAKVADFGISKSTPDQVTMTDGQYSTLVRGTPGYLDPEYYMLQKLSQKSDVYSFGVVLMEIIAGRRPISMNSDGTQFNIINLMKQCLQNGDIYSIADAALGGQFNPESVWKMAEIAWSSVEREGANRPDMIQVVRGLTEAIDMEKSYHTDNQAMDMSFTTEGPTSRGIH